MSDLTLSLHARARNSWGLTSGDATGALVVLGARS
jgi:hypothetical protein